jgi:hypothetical protein
MSFFLAVALAAVAAAATTSRPEVLLWQSSASFNTHDYDIGVLVATLQGLANRNTTFNPTRKALFVDSFELFNNWVGADRYWVKYLEQKKDISFQNISSGGLHGLLAALPGVAKGVVMYETPEGGDPDGARYVALTICGLEGLLPVTSSLRANFSALKNLPIVHDFRGKWNNSAAAYSWSLEHLMPRVNQSVGWSAGRSHTGDAGEYIWQGGPPEMALLGLDVAIARQGFMFNLSPNSTLSSSEAAIFDAVMAGLNGSSVFTTDIPWDIADRNQSPGRGRNTDTDRPLPAIYGWSEPESEFTIRVSNGGGYVLCSGAPSCAGRRWTATRRGST